MVSQINNLQEYNQKLANKVNELTQEVGNHKDEKETLTMEIEGLKNFNKNEIKNICKNYRPRMMKFLI